MEEWRNEMVALLGLASLTGVGYWTLYHASKAEGSFLALLRRDAQDAFVASLKEYGARGVKGLAPEWNQTQRMIWSAGMQQYQQLRAEGIRILLKGQPEFPDRLRGISDPPEWIFYEGNAALFGRPAVTLVGTRKASDDGDFLCRYVTSLLSAHGLVTVSGLAEGIDRLVHEYSVRFKLPTVAVLGNGILLDFPSDSGPLRQSIVDNGGLIVTEYLPSQIYSAENFVRRNRLQAALGGVVIPVEWRARSGTAHTVRFATEQQRRLICLRLPDWDAQDHPELAQALAMGAQVFTAPGQESEILSAILDGANNGDLRRAQLALFEG